jgi:hypothetical protein
VLALLGAWKPFSNSLIVSYHPCYHRLVLEPLRQVAIIPAQAESYDGRLTEGDWLVEVEARPINATRECVTLA